MANLIIKPSAGGDLKLQDEGSTDAITISTTGNTTLAGTANGIGTVTTGNISNTAIVYPVGHILQTFQSTYSSESNTTSGNFNAPAGVNFEVQITPASASNKILISTTWEAEFADSAGSGNVDFYRSIAGGATVQFIAGNSLTSEGMGQAHASDNSDRYVCTYSYLDSPSVSGVVVSYRPSLRSPGTGAFYIGSGSNGKSTITAQEIKG